MPYDTPAELYLSQRETTKLTQLNDTNDTFDTVVQYLIDNKENIVL